jgi:hypothetical protein
MGLRSPSRAAEDSLRFLLKRRLPNNDPSDHMRYIEIEAARIVETLRHLRDQYRMYFEKQGCQPVAQMYWVVLRFGVKDWAIMALRSAAVDYVAASQTDVALWKALFDFSGPYNYIFAPELVSGDPSKPTDAHEKLRKAIAALLPQTAFNQVIDGGPFGRENQVYLARSFPGRAFFDGLETFAAAIERRQKSWDNARPWSEGLATLFEVTQQEVIVQFDALGAEAEEAERRFVHLTDFERIAYKHLMNVGGGEVAAETTAKDRWPKLLLALDEAGILPDTTLEGVAREALMVSRRKGLNLRSWQECYTSIARVTLEDLRGRTLRREVTHAIHNAAKKAEYQLGKIWGRKTPPATRQPKVSTKSQALDAKKSKQ